METCPYREGDPGHFELVSRNQARATAEFLIGRVAERFDVVRLTVPIA